jgi:hypothetical protein
LIDRQLYRKALFDRFLKFIVQAESRHITAGGAASFSERCLPDHNDRHGELSLMIAFQPKAFE